MPGMLLAYRSVESFCITLTGFQGYIGHHMYLEMVNFNQLDMHSHRPRIDLECQSGAEVLCSKRPAMRFVG